MIMMGKINDYDDDDDDHDDDDYYYYDYYDYHYYHHQYHHHHYHSNGVLRVDGIVSLLGLYILHLLFLKICGFATGVKGLS